MISSVYSYYMSTYAGRQTTKYDSHKKSELRDIYNSMVKINKKSPLFQILDNENVQKFAIDLKETAREFKNVAASLTSDDETVSGFMRKKAVSSNAEAISVEYIGHADDMEEADDLFVEVNSLATSQINTGNYLDPHERTFKEGSYAFDVKIGDYTYEFSFAVKEKENNDSVQNKIVRLFNKANIGIVAAKAEDADGNRAVKLESVDTGAVFGKNGIFSIEPSEKSDANVVEILGLDNITRASGDAHFTINGEEYSTSGNVFNVKQQYQLTLNSITDENAVEVGIKQDYDSIVENINELLSSYNSMVGLATKKAEGEKPVENSILSAEIKSMLRFYSSELKAAGFAVDEDGSIHVDDETLSKVSKEGNIEKSLETLDSFKKILVKKANDISLDPMKYVNKKMISYPNPIRNFASPYVTSIYSGMMFNGYI